MTTDEFAGHFRKHYGLLTFWLLSSCRNQAMAEDIASNAFAQAWEHRERLQGPFRPWLYKIAYNALRMDWRSCKPEPLEEGQDAVDPLDFTEELARYYETRRIAQAAELMRESLRRALWCHVRGFSIKETAANLGVPAGTAGRRVWQAKKELKEALR